MVTRSKAAEAEEVSMGRPACIFVSLQDALGGPQGHAATVWRDELSQRSSAHNANGRISGRRRKDLWTTGPLDHVAEKEVTLVGNRADMCGERSADPLCPETVFHHFADDRIRQAPVSGFTQISRRGSMWMK
jgi:hypothetical protein